MNPSRLMGVRRWVGAILGLMVVSGATAPPQPANREVVCEQGLLRWRDTGEEAALFDQISARRNDGA